MPRQNHILYVEHDEYERMALAELIEIEGFRVYQAASLEGAVASLRSNSIDLLLINVSLPASQTEGYSALRLVNDTTYKKLPKILVLVDEDMQIKEAVRPNPSVIDFYYKGDPQRLNKLFRTLRNYLDV